MKKIINFTNYLNINLLGNLKIIIKIKDYPSIKDFHPAILEQVGDFIIIFDPDRTEFSSIQFQLNLKIEYQSYSLDYFNKPSIKYL